MPDTLEFSCDKCEEDITAGRHRIVIKDADGDDEKQDLCVACYEKAVAAGLNPISHKFFEAGQVDNDDYKFLLEDSGETIDLIVSRGTYGWKLTQVQPGQNGIIDVSISNEDFIDEDEGEELLEDTVGLEEKFVVLIRKLFNVDSNDALTDKTFGSKEKRPRDAVQELILAGKHGLDRKAPNREETTQIIVNALVKLEKPELPFTESEIYKFLQSLFDGFSLTDPDPVATEWLNNLKKSVAEASNGQVEIVDITPDDLPFSLNSVKQIIFRAQSKDGKGSKISCQIAPASNGFLIHAE